MLAVPCPFIIPSLDKSTSNRIRDEPLRTTGSGFFAESREPSAKAKKPSAKALPRACHVALGKDFAEGQNSPRQSLRRRRETSILTSSLPRAVLAGSRQRFFFFKKKPLPRACQAGSRQRRALPRAFQKGSRQRFFLKKNKTSLLRVCLDGSRQRPPLPRASVAKKSLPRACQHSSRQRRRQY